MIRANTSAPEAKATVDFETRSACDLRACGAWKYSLDPSTEVLCLVYRLPYWPDGRTALWTPSFAHLGIAENFDEESLLELCDWIESSGLIEAHGAFFERAIWTNILTPRYGFPLPRPHTWRCSAAKAAAHALPRKLGEAGRALKLSIIKNDGDTGHKLMMKMNKPRKPRKKEREAWLAQGKRLEDMPYLWWETSEQLQALWQYCAQDVLAEEALSEALDDLSPEETVNYSMDQTINQRGFKVDIEAVEMALHLISQESAALNAELSTITEGSVERATQRDRMKAWLKTQDVHLYDTKGATIDALLKEDDANRLAGPDELPPWMATLPAAARRAVEILRTLGRSSTAKYETMLDWACRDGRVRGGLLYHGASTGRWSGAGVQPHNFPKGTIKGFDMEEAWELIKTGDRDAIAARWGRSVMEVLACALRGAIIATRGSRLFVADYAGIEVRVLWWVADDKVGLKLLQTPGADPYCSLASDIYKREITKKDPERQLGKAGILGCLSADTPVLTRRGWLPITWVSPLDKVWDGDNWVSHDGVVAQGLQETIRWNGLQLTPDHKIWTGTKWQPAEFLAAPENDPSLQSALDSARSALPALREAVEEGLSECVLNVNIWFLSPAGIYRIWKSTELMSTAITPPVTYNSPPEANSAKTNDDGTARVPVYDILNAGPRFRFTVWSEAGPLIVSNCGYGMGATKFVGTALDMFGLTVTDEESQQVVDTYRQKFHRTKSFWYETEDAACLAVRHPGRVVPQKWVSWQRVVDKVRKTDFLFCTLPNGRRLAYPFPELREKETPWGEMKWALTFKAVSVYTRKWTREHTYGGKLVENIVQAISRDLMAEALQACEAGGVYTPVLSVHDEVVAEVKSGQGDLHQFVSVLTQIPTWAPGCPVGAEGFIAERYRKA